MGRLVGVLEGLLSLARLATEARDVVRAWREPVDGHRQERADPPAGNGRRIPGGRPPDPAGTPPPAGR